MLLRIKSKKELLKLFKKNGYEKDLECDSYYAPCKHCIFTFEMFDVCGKIQNAIVDNYHDYDYVINIGNENFGVKKEWCVEITENMIKEKLSKIIGSIGDGSIENIVRKTIFEFSENIEWGDVYENILLNMPEEK